MRVLFAFFLLKSVQLVGIFRFSRFVGFFLFYSIDKRERKKIKIKIKTFLKNYLMISFSFQYKFFFF